MTSDKPPLSCFCFHMRIPTEPIGSVPRPSYLIEAVARYRSGSTSRAEFDSICDKAIADTIAELEATGSPIITDGEQTKSSFVSYPLDGLDNLAPDGVSISFADGHVRQLPRLTQGPFRYSSYAGEYVRRARRFTKMPLKQAVIAPSALSLLYPDPGINDYPREAFLEDLLAESEREISAAALRPVRKRFSLTSPKVASRSSWTHRENSWSTS